MNKITKFLIAINLITSTMFAFSNNSYAAAIEDSSTADKTQNGIVVCGNSDQKPCTIDDLFVQANKLAGFILKVIFPVIFFFGLFMVAWPLINQFAAGDNAVDIKESKRRAKMLVIGTVLTVGAFLIVKAVLAGLGYNQTDGIVNPVKSNVSSVIIFEGIISSAYAEGGLGFLPDPLADASVQKVTLGIANIFVYIILVCAILGIVRGVIYLLLGQENSNNIAKGKKWILGSLSAAALVFGAQLFYSIIVDTASSVFG